MLNNYLKNTVNRNWNSFDASLNEQLHHSILGLTEESGEVAGLLKKSLHYGPHNPRDIGKDDFCDELGDVLYYFMKTIDLCGLSIEQVIARNEKKLKERHDGNFKGDYRK